MNQKQIKAAVEAMLFAAGDPVSADKLAAAVQLPQTTVETALEDLRVRYAREDSGLCLLHLDTRWQLATKTEWADCIRRLLDARRSVPLGPAAMETLTIIAYNQPVSRAFIEQVRGVDSSSSVSGLLQKGLIEEAGRLDRPPGELPHHGRFPAVLRPFFAGGPAAGARRSGRGGGDMMGVLMALGWLLLTLLKIAGVLLLILLVLLALVLLCPLCADVCWEGGVLTVRAGALGLTLPVFQWPAPEKPAGAEEPKGFWGKLKAKFRARREERKRKKAAAKEAKRPKKETAPRRKAKLTLNILVTILRGAGRLTKAVFGSLRVTKIRVCLGVRGEDPAEAARAYGRLNAWLYPSLGVIDRFVYLDFDELRILPDFGSAEPTVADRVSFHLSARLLFIVAAALRVLYEFWREKVLDVFL